ncbi:hypothetical protein I7I53_00553 [Histoplasma capsulatum var. duboisii H88]|uniref:Secreted protein n=1 Tax=Ajellomyces capsulatus (strain H88) TaxID=544711 RepID=A0A8A1LK18_AJEC8|nr:hypothetical protein I7I53_00553 [Histoplasma capsulatum var. duboisii H88]
MQTTAIATVCYWLLLAMSRSTFSCSCGISAVLDSDVPYIPACSYIRMSCIFPAPAGITPHFA